MFKSQSRYMFQMIDSDTGCRCEPFICSLESLKIYLQNQSKEIKDKFYLMPLADIEAEAKGDLDALMGMLRWPLMRVSTFLEQPFMLAIKIEEKQDV